MATKKVTKKEMVDWANRKCEIVGGTCYDFDERQCSNWARDTRCALIHRAIIRLIRGYKETK